MTTLATMRSRIIRETSRTDLETEIDDAIRTAIETYKSHRLKFLLETVSVVTVSSQMTYTMDLIAIDSVVGPSGAIREVAPGFLDLYASAGVPLYFSWQLDTLRLGPVPNSALTLKVAGIKKLATLTTGAGTNAWMTDGEALIRSAAKAIIARDVIKDQVLMQASEAAEQLALAQLVTQTSAKDVRPKTPPQVRRG
jgi:hypothetical protein